MSEPAPKPPSDREDPFYVGYLTTPQAYRSSVKLAIALIAIWGAMSAFLIVLSQRSPGSAEWDISNEKAWTGLLIEHPYPMLVTHDDALLVVSMGKRDARNQLEGHYGSELTIRGYELDREGRKMIELAPDGIGTPQKTTTIERPEIRIVQDEPREYTGEIIDGKCFLGAMKPGDGFGHRSCAVLCLRGGLPPMFAEDNAPADARYPLLLIDGSASVPESLMGKVACKVRMRATPARYADMPVLLVDSSEIEVIDDLFARSAVTTKP